MEKIFISYPFTGVDPEHLAEILEESCNAIRSENRDIFCALLRKEDIDSKNIFGYENRLNYCLEQQKLADVVVALLFNRQPSNGMYQELQLAKQLKQKYFLVIRKDFEFSEYREFATRVFEYTNEGEIPNILIDILDKNKS